MLQTIERIAYGMYAVLFRLFSGESIEAYYRRNLSKQAWTQVLIRSQIELERELINAGFVAGIDFISNISTQASHFRASKEVTNFLISTQSKKFTTYLHCVKQIETLKKPLRK